MATVTFLLPNGTTPSQQVSVPALVQEGDGVPRPSCQSPPPLSKPSPGVEALYGDRSGVDVGAGVSLGVIVGVSVGVVSGANGEKATSPFNGKKWTASSPYSQAPARRRARQRAAATVGGGGSLDESAYRGLVLPPASSVGTYRRRRVPAPHGPARRARPLAARHRAHSPRHRRRGDCLCPVYWEGWAKRSAPEKPPDGWANPRSSAH
jgi:hypothetical protein